MKSLSIFSALVLSLMILAFIFCFISCSPYRKQLPEFPDFRNVPETVKKQILTAHRKAMIFPSSENIGILGMVYNSNAFYDEASKCYQIAIEINSDDWRWSYYLGYLNMERVETNASIENFSRVILKDPENYLAMFYCADAYQNSGLTQNAEAMFRKIARRQESHSIGKDSTQGIYFPVQTYAGFRLARIYANTDRTDSAELLLKNIIKSQNTFGPAYRLLGNLCTSKGNLVSAKRYILLANDLDEYTPPTDLMLRKIALMSRSEAYLLKQIDDALNVNNQALALQLCEQGLKYIFDSKILISKSINGYFAMGYNEKGYKYLEKHFRYFSDDFKELMSMAGVLLGKGFNKQALTYFNQAKKLQPDKSRLALWLSDIGKQEEAVALLNDQLTRNPENREILADAIKLILRMDKTEAAKTYLGKLKRVSPSGKETMKLTGVIAEREGKLQEALSNYEEAYKSDTTDMEIIKYLAEIYLREKMWTRAVNHFRKALKTLPNEPVLLEGLGNMLITCPDTGIVDLKEGIDYSERAFINFKTSFLVRISSGKNLATAYAQLGDKSMASYYIKVTSNLAKNSFANPDLFQYFESLKEQYSLFRR